MTFLWAGVVEFINHPPYFDAYGDAKKNTDELPRNIMHVSLLCCSFNDIKSFLLMIIYSKLQIKNVILLWTKSCLHLSCRMIQGQQNGYEYYAALSLLLFCA